MIVKKIPIVVLPSLFTFLFLLLANLPLVVAQDLPSASDVVRRCLEAMKPPIQFTRHSQNGSTSEITLAATSDGKPAVRIEYLKLMTTSLIVGDKCFAIFPEQKLLLDTSALLEEFFPIGHINACDAFESRNLSQCSLAMKDLRSGVKCFEIKFPASPTLSAMSFLVDRKTYQLIESHTYDAQGLKIKTYSFSKISPVDVSDTFFAVPEGMETHVITERAQYVTFVKGVLTERAGKKSQAAIERIRARAEAGILESKEKTKAVVKAILEAQPRAKEPREPVKNRSPILFAAGILIFFIGLVWFRRNQKS